MSYRHSEVDNDRFDGSDTLAKPNRRSGVISGPSLSQRDPEML